MAEQHVAALDTIPCPDSRSGTWPIQTTKPRDAPRVLLVDADCNAAAAHARILRAAGIHVRTVACFEAARGFAAFEPFDAVIADPSQPDDAAALCADIWKINPILPVLLLSDDPSTWTAVNDLNDPVLSCLIKPFSEEHFERHISSMLERVWGHFEQLDGR